MFESMRFVRKGKYNPETISKYIKMYAPVQFQEEWLRGIEACRDVGGIHILRYFLSIYCNLYALIIVLFV